MEVYKNKFIYKLDGDISFLKEEKYTISTEQHMAFEEFLDWTNQWVIDSLDLFFKFRYTVFEDKFENSTRLIEMLQTNKMKSIFTKESENEKDEIKYLDSLNIVEKTSELSSIVEDKIKNNLYPINVIKFINGLLELTKHYNIRLHDVAYRAIYNKLKTPSFKEKLYMIDVNNLIDECLNKIEDDKLKKSITNMVKKQWITDYKNYYKTKKDE